MARFSSAPSAYPSLCDVGRIFRAFHACIAAPSGGVPDGYATTPKFTRDPVVSIGVSGLTTKGSDVGDRGGDGEVSASGSLRGSGRRPQHPQHPGSEDSASAAAAAKKITFAARALFVVRGLASLVTQAPRAHHARGPAAA